MQKKEATVEKEVPPATESQVNKIESHGYEHWTPATDTGLLWPNP